MGEDEPDIESRKVKSRFKAPFTDGLLKNTENLQNVLRRCLFRCQFSADRETDKYTTILKFFERIETAEEIDKNLQHQNIRKNFEKA